MSFLQSNIPHFPCFVRREYTHNHQQYHGEFLHALAIAVTTIPDRSLSFQVVFTGAETYDDDNEPNVHGGAMWARMPINALVADVPLEDWPDPMPAHLVQPWDCSSRHHDVIVLERVNSSLWICKIAGEFYMAKYYFTVDYTDHSIADDPAQHKQSHVLELTDAGPWTGNIIALPNNRVRCTNPALWQRGEGAPDFKPSQWVMNAESDDSYLDAGYTFDNLYAKGEQDGDER